MYTSVCRASACALGVSLAVMGSAHAVTPGVTGLRADIYSTTTTELFWDRVPNTALQYEVARDDGLLGTTNGTSYFDATRSPGAVNEYTVTAIAGDGERSEPLSIAVQPFDQTGLQVLHLRADVYSATAAELFWVRVPNRDLSYEILRDDGQLAVTHGDSYFDNTRQPGVAYDYTVTVIDEQGVRAMPATLRVGPFGVESIDSPPVTGLRATVYSAVAAELHWDRVPNRALRYAILRDDGLENLTNGNSYFDNKRLPGRANTYLVTTIDEEGNRSTAVPIDVPAF